MSNMSAKDMFEKLGYEVDSTCEIEGHLYYCRGYTKIDFDLIRKDFYKYNLSGFKSPIDMKLLKAINKQIEELHWNE